MPPVSTELHANSFLNKHNLSKICENIFLKKCRSILEKDQPSYKNLYLEINIPYICLSPFLDVELLLKVDKNGCAHQSGGDDAFRMSTCVKTLAHPAGCRPILTDGVSCPLLTLGLPMLAMGNLGGIQYVWLYVPVNGLSSVTS